MKKQRKLYEQDAENVRLKPEAARNSGRFIISAIIFLTLSGGLYAQADFPAGDFWSLDAGIGMSNILVEGTSYQLVIDPKLWLSPPLMVGSKLGVNFSTDEILTLEGEVYLRWNFLRAGNPLNTVNIFAQAGIGMLAAYRGDGDPFDNVKRTRGSLLFDGALGITIPLSDRWHIEPQIRGGYPHMAGFSLTAGYKIPLPRNTEYIEASPQIEYREILRRLPPNEIVKRIMINSVEFIIFGPDIERYNAGLDPDAQGLNELVLDETAELLIANPDYIVRIEGHANPVTSDPNEADELMTLSALRANTIAEQLKKRGVPEAQMVIIAFGGTRTVTSDHDIWNRNRRVEMTVIQVMPESTTPP